MERFLYLLSCLDDLKSLSERKLSELIRSDPAAYLLGLASRESVRRTLKGLEGRGLIKCVKRGAVKTYEKTSKGEGVEVKLPKKDLPEKGLPSLIGRAFYAVNYLGRSLEGFTKGVLAWLLKDYDAYWVKGQAAERLRPKARLTILNQALKEVAFAEMELGLTTTYNIRKDNGEPLSTVKFEDRLKVNKIYISAKDVSLELRRSGEGYEGDGLKVLKDLKIGLVRGFNGDAVKVLALTFKGGTLSLTSKGKWREGIPEALTVLCHSILKRTVVGL